MAMANAVEKPVEEALDQLPQLLEDAANGRATIITDHGRPVAALVPIEAYRAGKQQSLLDLAGTGRGLWGPNSTETLAKLRDEWSR